LTIKIPIKKIKEEIKEKYKEAGKIPPDDFLLTIIILKYFEEQVKERFKKNDKY
jgi:hypothetical protein